MTHARTFGLSPAADPIHAAIEQHRASIDAYQYAPSLITNDDVDAATDLLVATPCATRFGALALLEHLLWWLKEEAEFSTGNQPAYRLALARAADLSLFLGTNLPPVAIPRAMPSGRLAAPIPHRPLPAVDRLGQGAASAPPNERVPGEIEPWEAVTPVRPDTPHSRAPRFLDLAGEALAAIAIIGGGMVLTGLASLL